MSTGRLPGREPNISCAYPRLRLRSVAREYWRLVSRACISSITSRPSGYWRQIDIAIAEEFLILAIARIAEVEGAAPEPGAVDQGNRTQASAEDPVPIEAE